MPEKDYSKYTKDELIKIIRKVEKKRYGLVWEDKPEKLAEECKTKLPVITEIKNKEIITDKSKTNNIFIEGDNYHVLWVLNYTHRKKIDVIYIDPPYNTGNKSWKYNNNYVEKEDSYRHSKWLSFMHKRLKLAKTLLKDSGIIVVAIDDYELFTLGLLMDDIFNENNKIGVIAIENNPRGRTSNAFFATSHEYYLFYAKNSTYAKINNLSLTEEQAAEFKFEDEISKFRLLPLRKTGAASRKNDRPKQFYSIYFEPESLKISLTNKKGWKENLPIDTSGEERVWKLGIDNCRKLIYSGEIIVKKNNKGNFVFYQKDRIKSGRKPKTVWLDPKYDASAHGTILISNILCKNNLFDYPKSLHAVLDVLSVLVSDNKNAIILDFFAGSGTTAHAVLELNKRDGGGRQFIICTNNENNNGNGGGIAETVCYPRVQKVIQGYKNLKGKQVEGLGGNLKYFKTAFVPFIKTDEDKRALTKRSTEMLCIAEQTYEEIIFKDNQFALFQNEKQITAIIYEEDYIDNCKIEIKKYEKPIVIYVFSYDKEYNHEDFNDLSRKIKIRPIPEAILNIYRRLYKK